MRMLSTGAAAKIAGCSSDTIRRACQSEDLRAEMVEGKRGLVWKVREDSLRDWIEEREREKQERLEEAQGSVAAGPQDGPSIAAEEPQESTSTAEGPQDGSAMAAGVLAAMQESLKEALEVAREQRVDRLEAERRATEAEQNAFRLARQIQALMTDMDRQKRLLSENAESLIEKDAELKQQLAINEEKAERERAIREEAEAETYQARAEALEFQEKLKAAEQELEKIRAEAEESSSKLKEARTEIEGWESRRKQSFWSRILGRSG
jgi:hypothetical protein